MNAITLITWIALEEERTKCGNMSFEKNLQEKFLELANKVDDETMVELGVQFEGKGGKFAWKLDHATSTQIYYLCSQIAPQDPP